MVLRCKTLIFHIFEKIKIRKKIFEKIEKNLKNISLTINNN